MPSRRSTRLVALSVLLALTGCGAVDQFSDRAASYNDQAETIKEQQFLTNIMRAAYREPLQFSDFTQITGQASVSGTAGFSLPIATIPSTVARTFTATPGATLSGTQSFTVANLNTQDFYEGILSPIPMSSIDYYMQADYPKALALTLFIQRIEFRAPHADKAADQLPSYIYRNQAAPDVYQRFEAVLQAAIDLGLTTETVAATQTIGPPLTAAQLPDLRYLAALSSSAKLKTYELVKGKPRPADAHLTASEAKAFAAAHVGEYYRLVSSAQSTHFCFAEAQADTPQMAATLHDINGDLQGAGVLRAGLTLSGFALPPADICGAPATAAADDGDAAEGDGQADDPSRMITFNLEADGQKIVRHYQVVISTRSVEGIMYYLGEWVRAELGIDPTAGASGPPLVATGRGEDELFVVANSCPADGPAVTADVDGQAACMRIDASGRDRSAQVMDIVSQLFALNNSAKNLPASSLISVLSP